MAQRCSQSWGVDKEDRATSCVKWQNSHRSHTPHHLSSLSSISCESKSSPWQLTLALPDILAIYFFNIRQKYTKIWCHLSPPKRNLELNCMYSFSFFFLFLFQWMIYIYIYTHTYTYRTQELDFCFSETSCPKTHYIHQAVLELIKLRLLLFPKGSD